MYTHAHRRREKPKTTAAGQTHAARATGTLTHVRRGLARKKVTMRRARARARGKRTIIIVIIRGGWRLSENAFLRFRSYNVPIIILYYR